MKTKDRVLTKLEIILVLVAAIFFLLSEVDF